MARLIRMADYRTGTGLVHFERAELTQLLALYAVRVAGGEWRDYAIDVGPDRAVFSVFRHTLERAAFTITKSMAGGGECWSVSTGGRVLRRAARLIDALTAFDHHPRPV